MTRIFPLTFVQKSPLVKNCWRMVEKIFLVEGRVENNSNRFHGGRFVFFENYLGSDITKLRC